MIARPDPRTKLRNNREIEPTSAEVAGLAHLHGGILAAMRLVVAIALSVPALTACAPLSLQPAVDGSGDAKPAEQGTYEPRCGRQFDAEGAGFQTCRAGESKPSE